MEVGVGLPGDNSGQMGLADPRRPGEQHATQRSGSDSISVLAIAKLGLDQLQGFRHHIFEASKIVEPALRRAGLRRDWHRRSFVVVSLVTQPCDRSLRQQAKDALDRVELNGVALHAIDSLRGLNRPKDP
ncbi:hypothetical protein D3C80_1558820 [compost metagenome]